jgi:drug/metabolite transporter (DMT)-like permease
MVLRPSPNERLGRFTLRQLGILQWTGTILAPAIWFSQHLYGWGVGEAVCHAGAGWGVNYDVYQLTALAVVAVVEIATWVCALIVFLHTRGADWGDGPPEEGRWGAQEPYGRLHFFAVAGMVANVLFLAVALLSVTAAVTDVLCRQS